MSTNVGKLQAKRGLEAYGHKISTIASFGDHEYYLDPAAAEVISFQPSPHTHSFFNSLKGDLRPCTVINGSKDQLDNEDFHVITSDFTLHDDVWTPAFLEVVILQTPHASKLYFTQHGAHASLKVQPFHLLTGPYAIRPSTGEIFRVSRLYEDECSAFSGGSIASNTQLDSFQWFNNRIAVPSRIGPEPTSTRPLARLRFAVKDVIDVAGLETGLGNRSYRSLYPSRPASARCINRLLEAGAVFVGKTKTTQFAEGQAPIQWTDYLAPFNPRGDWYQSPSSSSSGSAVASAAYPWLDFSIGTDTGGSTRHPAGVCGTYGMRASTNSISTAGIYSVSPLLDSIGVFARSAPIVEAVMKVLIESPLPPSIPLKPPVKYKLLYPIRAKNTHPEDSHRWFPSPGEPGPAADVDHLFEQTVQKLESHLNCPRTPFNLDDLWRQTRPADQSETLDSATGTIYTTLSTHLCVRDTIDPFIADFKSAHNNHLPPIDAIVRARHDHGRTTTATDHQRALHSAAIFSHWVRDTLLAAPTPHTFPLLIFPQSCARPTYRDEPATGPLFSSTFSTYSLSYLSGCPDCTVPVGQVARKSRVTGADMLLPVSLSVLSPPGTDLQLLALLSEMEGKGVLRAVRAGREMYAEAG